MYVPTTDEDMKSQTINAPGSADAEYRKTQSAKITRDNKKELAIRLAQEFKNRSRHSPSLLQATISFRSIQRIWIKDVSTLTHRIYAWQDTKTLHEIADLATSSFTGLQANFIISYDPEDSIFRYQHHSA